MQSFSLWTEGMSEAWKEDQHLQIETGSTSENQEINERDKSEEKCIGNLNFFVIIERGVDWTETTVFFGKLLLRFSNFQHRKHVQRLAKRTNVMYTYNFL